jgi:NarL family two-component system sensor histidine kinase LiaS
MDATISLHTSGRRINWFSNPKRYALVLLLLAVAILGSFGFVVLSSRQWAAPVDESLARLGTVNELVRQAVQARVLVERALASDDTASYRAAELALVESIDAIEQTKTQLDDYFTLNHLEQISTDYLNTFRGLSQVTASGAPSATRSLIRQQLDKIAAALDEEGSTVVQSSMAATSETMNTVSASATTSGAILLLALSLLFGAFAALALTAVRQQKHTLGRLGQGAALVAQGNYDTRIDLAGENDPNLVGLVEAFNRTGELLKNTVQSESAATRQNRLQIMKLARQERRTAVLEERQRIARELHDSVKQQLFSITLSAGAALNLLDHAPQTVRTHLEHIRQSGHNAQAEMTALIQELIPVSLQEQRLEEALLGYLNPLCETHGLKLLWRVNGTNALTIAQEHALLRAVQEAVSNVVRHSGATVVRVSLTFGLVTHVIIEDNGEGFVPEEVAPTATGLSLMRMRLKRVGGRCELQSAPGMGTRIGILMDLRRAAPTSA